MGPVWCDWEVEVLQSEKDSLPLTLIAKVIGRTPDAVRSFLCKSGFSREYFCHYCHKPIEDGKTQQKYHKECYPLARAEYIKDKTRQFSAKRKIKRMLEDRKKRYRIGKLKELSKQC